MAKVGAQRAAVLTGKSKSTVQRAMNSGKLSYELDQNGRRVIDVSELERVFGIRQQTAQQPAQTPAVSVEDAVEKEHLRVKVQMLERQLGTAQGIIEDLKDQRDKWEKQASQVLITSQYSQRQAEELRAEIREREERAKKRRMQTQPLQDSQRSKAPQKTSGEENLDTRMRKLKAENENTTREAQSRFIFWKRAKA